MGAQLSVLTLLICPSLIGAVFAYIVQDCEWNFTGAGSLFAKSHAVFPEFVGSKCSDLIGGSMSITRVPPSNETVCGWLKNH